MHVLSIPALCLLLLFSVPGISAAAGLFGSKEAPFECAFEKDHNPPLDEASEAHKLYLQARELENAKLLRLPSEEKKIADLYIKAAEMGHWKGKAMMVYRYTEGLGVSANTMRAYLYIKDLVRINAPIGLYNMGVYTLKGWGPDRPDEKEGMRLIHKAAALGNIDAQYMLGEHYIYKEHDAVTGLKYHICAMRQGHGGSAQGIAVYLRVAEQNYPLYVEFLLRGGGLGRQGSFVALQTVFDTPDDAEMNLGYPQNTAVSTFANNHYQLMEKAPRLRFPTIGKECPLPEHPTLSNGRQLPSKLKEACGGMWPDEAYPELKDW